MAEILLLNSNTSYPAFGLGGLNFVSEPYIDTHGNLGLMGFVGDDRPTSTIGAFYGRKNITKRTYFTDGAIQYQNPVGGSGPATRGVIDSNGYYHIFTRQTKTTLTHYVYDECDLIDTFTMTIFKSDNDNWRWTVSIGPTDRIHLTIWYGVSGTSYIRHAIIETNGELGSFVNAWSGAETVQNIDTYIDSGDKCHIIWFAPRFTNAYVVYAMINELNQAMISELFWAPSINWPVLDYSQIIVDSLGMVHILFVPYSTTPVLVTGIYYASRSALGVWTTNELHSLEHDNYYEFSKMSLDKNENVWISYIKKGGGSTKLYTMTRNRETMVWGADVEQINFTTELPGSTINSLGHVHKYLYPIASITGCAGIFAANGGGNKKFYLWYTDNFAFSPNAGKIFPCSPDQIPIDCGQVGQILALDVATATLNAATVPDGAFDCACCTPIEA